MKAPYRNALKTRILIRETILRMLSGNKKLSDITVSDVVDEANINRGTFYNHYGSPIEVLEEMKNELMDKLEKGLEIAASNKDIDAFIDFVIDHCKKNEEEYRKVINAIPTSTIDDMKGKFIQQLYRIDEKLDAFKIHLAINGIAGLYLDYLKGSISFTYDEASVKLKAFLHQYLAI